MTRRVDVVYFDAASGHRSAAQAVVAALQARRPEWLVRAVDLLDVIAGNRGFWLSSRAGIGYFNWMVRRDRVWDLKGLIRLSIGICEGLRPVGLRRIATFWRDRPPDAVVSVTPMNNEPLFRALRLVASAAPYITIPVDFEEVLPRYWFTPAVDAHYLVASKRLREQALEAGVPEDRIRCLSGMVVDPAFYEPPPADIPGEIARLGLDPERPLGLVSYGGQGSRAVLDIARQLARVQQPINAIFLCGRNQRLKAALEALSLPYPRLVLGYSDQPPAYYHHLASFLVGKPGSMTITEALVTDTPLLAIKSTGMAPVQRGNEAWLEAHGAGLVVAGRKALPAAVERVLGGGFPALSGGRERSRGVFEAAAAIEELAAA